MSSISERVQEEIEALEAILMDDISVTYNESGGPELVKSTIFPSTADDIEKQYVCVTLEVRLPEDYPDCEPEVQLRNPRGLDDVILDHLYRAIKEKCSEYLGQPVIYELIEAVFKGALSEQQAPAVTEAEIKTILMKKFPNAKSIAVEDVSGGCGAMFNIFVETSDFTGLSIPKQHKAVYKSLEEQIKKIHGLHVQTKISK